MRSAMKVATSRSHTEPLALVELPSRPLRPDELRVKVVVAGVNPVDWKMREGGPLHLAYSVIGPGGTTSQWPCRISDRPTLRAG